MLHVTVYSKPGCHLCDEAKTDLLRLKAEIDLVVEERNILDDGMDFERYQYLIPVIDIRDGSLLHPPMDYGTLRRALLDAKVRADNG